MEVLLLLAGMLGVGLMVWPRVARSRSASTAVTRRRVTAAQVAPLGAAAFGGAGAPADVDEWDDFEEPETAEVEEPAKVLAHGGAAVAATPAFTTWDAGDDATVTMPDEPAPAPAPPADDFDDLDDDFGDAPIRATGPVSAFAIPAVTRPRRRSVLRSPIVLVALYTAVGIGAIALAVSFLGANGSSARTPAAKPQHHTPAAARAVVAKPAGPTAAQQQAAADFARARLAAIDARQLELRRARIAERRAVARRRAAAARARKAKARARRQAAQQQSFPAATTTVTPVTPKTPTYTPPASGGGGGGSSSGGGGGGSSSCEFCLG